MKAVIIDDEIKNSHQLKKLLSIVCPQVHCSGIASNAEEGQQLILETKPDLVFLDIQMPGKSGFDLLSDLGAYDFEVIFVTGFDQYALKAIKFSALDYLLKPIKAGELVHAVKKAENRTTHFQTSQQIHNLLTTLESIPREGHKLAIPFLKETRFINPYEIIYCESINGYTRFHLQTGEELLVSKGIAEYEEILIGYHFIRCHQSYLVNRQFVKSLLKKDNISELLLVNETRIPVSRLKRDFVKESLGTLK